MTTIFRTLLSTLPPYLAYAFFNSVPGRGSVSTADERRQYSIIVYDDLLWNALVVERASKQYDHAQDASWSLNWPSGANLQARKQHMYFFFVPL